MAKMFYTLDEAAQKLGVSADKVREMATSGQLQEFRDRDKLVFKVEQVDMLTGGDDESTIELADSGAGLTLQSDESRSGSGSAAQIDSATTKDKSGISIFEGDDSTDTDASAQTQITNSVGGMPMNMGDPGASGSGLLDITKSGNDTSLNAGLLEDVYQGGGQASGDASTDRGGDGLFESTGVNSDVGMVAGPGGLAMVAAEPYDAAWSGIGGGIALALVIILAVLSVVVSMAIMGVNGFALTTFLAGNLWMGVGILAAVILVCAGIGYAVGRR
ncbi:hypothetical protein BH11PLA1_BH11PLA1_16050 [soil metagenome]